MYTLTCLIHYVSPTASSRTQFKYCMNYTSQMEGIKRLQNIISPKLTQELLEDILKKEANADDVKINTINFGKEAKKGDFYLSVVIRFNINYTYKDKSGENVNSTIHLIGKGLPNNEARKKTFRSVVFFANEVAFYTKVWPILDSFQKSKNVSNPFKEIPRCLSAYADGINDYVILVDLSPDGYDTVPRTAGLSHQHVITIIKQFARFHALTVAYRHQHPEEFKVIPSLIKETYFVEKYRYWYENFQLILKEVIRDVVQKELPEKHQQKINDLFSKDLFKILCESCAKRCPLTTLNHGDPWIPNFLFKPDESVAGNLNVYMIDFQLTRISSLSTDLFFFIYSCTDGPYLEKHFEEVITYYCKEFRMFIKELGSSEDILTLDKLKANMKEHIAFGIAIPMEAVVMTTIDENDVSDLDGIEGDEAVPLESVWIIKPITTQEKRQRVAGFIKHAVDVGFL